MARRSFLRDNGLSLVLLALFGIFTASLGLAGWKEYNSEQARHGQPPVTLGQYLASAEFGEAVFENWESEFLQMGLYVVLTACLFQRGSSESKDPDEPDGPSRERPDSPGVVKRGGWRLALYRNSLSLAFVALFLVSFAGHALCGLGAANSEAIVHGEAPMSLWAYVSGSRFWFESFQNWQSEFLAVLAIVVLSIWLRQAGSPESKPVEAAHSETGV
jgi:hypothetical protein